MIRTLIILLLGSAMALPSGVQAQNSANNNSKGQTNLGSQYAVGVMANFRYAPLNTSYGLEQECWCLASVGLSITRHVKSGLLSNRAFWMVGVGYGAEVINQGRVADIRFTPNAPDGQLTTEVGTKTEEYDYRYISVPVSFNYLLFNTEGTNLYVAAEATFDWLHRLRLTREATYDGRTSQASNADFGDASATISLGAGLYQPIGSHLVLLFGFYRGHTFFSDFDELTNVRRNNGISQLSLRLHYKIAQ